MLLHKSFGIARHSFNWALNAWQKQACGESSEPMVQRTSVKQELLFNEIKF